MKFFEEGVNFIATNMEYFLWCAAILLLQWIWQREGADGLKEAVSIEVRGMFWKYLSIVAAFIVIAGAIDHLAKKNPDDVKALVAGEKGEALMIGVSAILPGPAGAKQLQTEWKTGKNPGNVIVCLAAMMGLGITMIIFRAKLLGGQLTLIWMSMAATVVFLAWIANKIRLWCWFQ